MLIELCTGTLDDVQLAAEHQPGRIELNCGMAVGGLTPSFGLIQEARSAFPGPIIAMIRPREGGFCYSSAEFLQMQRDCDAVLSAGLEGIAVGILEPGGRIDRRRLRQLRMLTGHREIVFHKAFDITPDLFQSLEILCDEGIQRILTSGGCSSALEGAEVLRQLHNGAAGRIEILPGGGIRSGNVKSILRLTGCNQVHTSVRESIADSSVGNSCELDFGSPASCPGGFGRCSAAELNALMLAVSERA